MTECNEIARTMPDLSNVAGMTFNLLNALGDFDARVNGVTADDFVA